MGTTVVTTRSVHPLEAAASALERVVSPLSRSGYLVSAVIAGVLAIPIVVDVLFRLVADRSVPGVIEVEEFALLAIVFFALAFVQAKKEHIRIDMLYAKMSPRVQATVDCFNWLVSLVLFGLIAWHTLALATVQAGTVTKVLSIPMSVIIGAAGVGAILLVSTLLIDLLRSIAKLLDKGWGLGLLAAIAGAALVYLIPTLIDASPWYFSGMGLGLLGMCFLFVLMLLGLPIGFSMGLVGFLGLWISKNLMAALSTLGNGPYSTSLSFILVVAPLFVLMGELALYSGISQDLFSTANKWLGRLPGGLAMSGVAGCAGFSAVCGDSMSTAITMGTVALPEMRKKDYDCGLATGSIAAGGTLGILIPPSIGFVFYAIVTEESVGKLFVAGIVPGFLLAAMYMAAIYIIAKRNPAMAPRGDATSWGEKFRSLKGVLGMLFLFVLILGGILGGFFSPTEGGAVGAFGAFLLTVARGRLTRKNLVLSLQDTVMITTKLLTILIGVGVLGYFLAATRLPMELAAFVTAFEFNRYAVFAVICVLYLALGCLMNVIPMILLTLPSLYPAVFALGFDPIWFGVIVVILMEAGQITPPVGVNVYALSSCVKDVSMDKIFRGILPFLGCQLLLIVLLVAFPEIATFLPNLLLK